MIHTDLKRDIHCTYDYQFQYYSTMVMYQYYTDLKRYKYCTCIEYVSLYKKIRNQPNKYESV